jgi:hypothetical protein
MIIILSWGRDLVIQPLDNIAQAKRLRAKMPDHEFIIHDSAFLCPVKLDIANRQLMEDEIIEFLQTSAYPELLEEGRMFLKNGKYCWRK